MSITQEDFDFLISELPCERIDDARDAVILLDGRTGEDQDVVKALVALDLIRMSQTFSRTQITQSYLDAKEQSASIVQLYAITFSALEAVQDNIGRRVGESYKLMNDCGRASVSYGFNVHNVSDKQGYIDEITEGYEQQKRVLGILKSISDTLQLDVVAHCNVQPLAFYAHGESQPVIWGGRSGPDELAAEGVAILDFHRDG